MATQKRRLIRTIGVSRHAHSQNFQETDSFQLVAKLRAAIERKATGDPWGTPQCDRGQTGSHLIECTEKGRPNFQLKRSSAVLQKFDRN